MRASPCIADLGICRLLREAAEPKGVNMNTPHYSGIIMNYVCTAECRHCMFLSSPSCPKNFITPEMSEHLADLLEKAGTSSVHIGGGEPFMNFPALCTLIRALNRHGIGVDYIETNAFWAKEEPIIRERLSKLRTLGVTTIMVSVDPFHIEFVPLERPLRLCRIMNDMDFDYFIWQDRYLRRFLRNRIDQSKTYTKEELQEILGKNYITDTASEYGLGMNGRALSIAGEIYPNRPAEEWLTSEPCPSLPDVCHCHLDLYGNIVPSGCPGLAAEAEDYLNERFDGDKYPVMVRLISGGTRKLYEYAMEKGFVPSPEGYPTKCAFCYAVRRYLHKNAPSPDLAPDESYR